eukprot:SAG22_NODE_246_length_13948_cov_12.055744_15_plen_91_part_00
MVMRGPAVGKKSKKNKKGLGLHVPTEDEQASAAIANQADDGEIRSSPLSAKSLAELSQSAGELDEVGLAEIQRGGLIGRGASGRVYRGLW